MEAAPARRAVSFSKGDIAEMTQKQLEEFDAYLLERSYVSGFSASQDDVFKFLQIKLLPDGLKNVQRWWKHISSFESEFATLPGDINQSQQVAQGTNLIKCCSGID